MGRLNTNATKKHCANRKCACAQPSSKRRRAWHAATGSKEEIIPREALASDVRVILGILRSKALLIAICTAGALVLAFLYTLFTPRVYSVQTVIQIEQEEQKVVKIEGIKSEDLKSLEALKTFEQNVTSPEVLLRVIHNPELRNDPTFLPEVQHKSDNALQQALARHIDARLRRGTRLIDITVNHRSPVMAEKIAKLLVQEFVRWNFEAQRDAAEVARRFLLDEATRLRTKLEQSEQALQSYKEQNEAVSLEDTQNITVEKLKELNLRVTTAKTERLKLESDYAETKSGNHRPPEDLLNVPAIANTRAVADLRKSISEKEAHLATLKERYKSGHPKFIEAASELQNLQTALERAIHKARDGIESSYQAAVLTERKLDEALRQQQKAALELNKISIPYAVLARDTDADRALYNSVLTRLKETDITANLTQNSVRIVARALLPDQPVSSKRKQALALGLLLGLACGSGIALVSNRSFNTLREAEALLGLRSLSEIPRLRTSRVEPKAALLEHDPAAEDSFRNLRSSLLLIQHATWRRTLLFTSAHPGEGKTFCAINCAISFAQLGFKTLIVDADVRESDLARSFFPEAPPSSSILPTDVPNLSAIFADKTRATSEEFVPELSFEQLMREAAAKFDRIVVDSAPVNMVSDTLLYAQHVQCVCLVIRAGKTPVEEVIHAVQRLSEAGAAPVGFVWNQARGVGGYYYGRPSRVSLPSWANKPFLRKVAVADQCERSFREASGTSSNGRECS
jgi:succinoglycan biosynthesis transport protein ExoP